MTIFKGTKIYSILTGSCPVCHRESMYLRKNPYQIAEVLKMHERCGYCHTKYKIEPSFFFGAMYVSYGVGLVFAGMVFVLVYLIFNFGLITTFIAVVITQILLLPIILRLSRNIWINIFMTFDKSIGLQD
ncbi:DUF983 domain-containing protein [Maribacter sp. 2210JD10-5]|uniref:DUF983 domain-containing protein n=1 Tax=Maribacter sp. 2210JD10-5 TaxID=3386272 RepID=UPI0039BCA713